MDNLWQKSYGQRIRYGYSETGYYDNKSVWTKDLFLQRCRRLWEELSAPGQIRNW